MLTKANKKGLVIAMILAVTDIAILLAYIGDGDQPPVGIAVISVIVGIIGLVAAYMAWSAPTRALMLTVIGTRVVSGLGDLAGLGEDAAIVTVSMVLLAITLFDIYLLRNWITRHETSTRPSPV